VAETCLSFITEALLFYLAESQNQLNKQPSFVLETVADLVCEKENILYQ